MKARALALAFGIASLAVKSGGAEQRAVYLAEGEDVRLFDHYDNDGYSLAVAAGARGSVELRVRVSDSPLESASPFPTDVPREGTLIPSPERDAFARSLTEGSRRQVEAVTRLLVGLASRVRYDPDRLRPQDPAAVFASGRADCVGFAELAVDLLRRVGVRARTVQGIVRTDPGTPAYDAHIGGSYHRWIEVYYPDRGYVFSDPSASINGVDARYLPFRGRSLLRPKSLTLVCIDSSGGLSYSTVTAGGTTLRQRPARPASGGR